MILGKKITILIALVFTVSSLLSQEKCEDILKKETGLKLYNYVVQTINDAFLKEKPNFNQWGTFYQCYSEWFNNLSPEIKKLYDIKAQGRGLTYSETFMNNRYNRQLKPINLAIEDIRKVQNTHYKDQLIDLKTQLEDRIEMLTKSLILSYGSLPNLNSTIINDKLPETIIDAYKKITNINFDPLTFLKAYNKTITIFQKKYKKGPEPKEILGILLGATGVNPVVISSKLGNIKTGVKEFINVLEELNYQSNRINKSKRFWNSNPKYLLNSSQITNFEAIIRALYYVYPDTITPFLQKRIEASNTNYDKLQLILFAQAQTLINVLQKDINHINSLLKE